MRSHSVDEEMDRPLRLESVSPLRVAAEDSPSGVDVFILTVTAEVGDHLEKQYRQPSNVKTVGPPGPS